MDMEAHTELPVISAEQDQVVLALRTHHVVTTSVPGSGKTTLGLHVISRFRNSRALVVTYNRVLCDEVNAKLQKLGLSHRAQAFTYHSLLGALTQSLCMNDEQFMLQLQTLKSTLEEFFDDEEDEEEPPPDSDEDEDEGEEDEGEEDEDEAGAKTRITTVELLQTFNLLILDEMQDMRKHHCRFIQTLQSFQSNVRLLCTGDAHQKLYDFYKHNPADERYMMLADKLFGPVLSPSPFKFLNLESSFRLTPHLAAFLNFICGSDVRGVCTSQPNLPVNIVVGNVFRKTGALCDYLQVLVSRHAPEDVLFLAPSVSYSKPLKTVIGNLISNLGTEFNIGHNLYKHNRGGLDDGPQRVLVNSFCAAKGLERKCVVVFGFGYEMNRNDVAARQERINQHYVALSRSCGGELHLVVHYTESLQWLKGCPGASVRVHELVPHQPRPLQTRVAAKIPVIHTRQMLGFVDTVYTQACTAELAVERVASPSGQKRPLSEEKKWETFTTVTGEDVHYIVVLAIPLMMEFETTHRCVRVEGMLQRQDIADKHHRRLDVLYHGQHVSELSTWLEISNLLQCASGFVHMLYQIQDYTWCDGLNLSHVRDFFAKNPGWRFNARRTCHGVDLVSFTDLDLLNQDTVYVLVFGYPLASENLLRVALGAYIAQVRCAQVVDMATGLRYHVTGDFAFVHEKLKQYYLEPKRQEKDNEKWLSLLSSN